MVYHQSLDTEIASRMMADPRKEAKYDNIFRLGK